MRHHHLRLSLHHLPYSATSGLHDIPARPVTTSGGAMAPAPRPLRPLMRLAPVPSLAVVAAAMASLDFRHIRALLPYPLHHLRSRYHVRREASDSGPLERSQRELPTVAAGAAVARDGGAACP